MKENWKYKKLTDVVWFQEGPGVRNTQYTDSGVKLLNVANLINGKVDLSTSKRYISEEEAYGKYRHFLVDEGDFIIASSGIQVEYFEKKMGFISASQLPLCMNTSTIRFKALDKNVLNMRFFMYYLKSEDFKHQLSRQITGIAQLNFGPLHLKRMSMPITDFETQSRIVSELDLLQSIIDKQKAQLKELDNLAQAVFYDMFGDPIENEKGWEVKKMEDICLNIVDCPHSTPKKANRITNYPCIRTSELKEGSIYWDSMQYLEEDEYEIRIARLKPIAGDIVFGREGTIGDAVILPDGYNFSLGQRTMLLRVDGSLVSNVFLQRVILSECVKKQIRMVNVSSTVPHVNIKDFKQFEIPVPPLSLQQSFASKIESIEKQKAAINQSIAETQRLFDFTMDKYFG